MGRKQVSAELLTWAKANGFEIVAVLTDSHLPNSPTARVAEQNGFPVLTLEQLQQEVLSGSFQVDIAVSVVYWRRITPPFLGLPVNGIINFHPAPLPQYKGTAGYNLGIMDGLDSWAVTAHYIDEEIDTGQIIDRFSFSIDPDAETAQSLEEKSMQFLADLFRKTMRRVLNDGVLPAEKNVGGNYTSRAQMEAMKKLEPDDDWDRKIRAFWFPPYTGAYIEKDGKKYTVINEQILQQLKPKGHTSLFD